MRIGLLGLGHLGEIHLKNWLEIVPKERLLIYDSNPVKLLEIQTKYQLQTSNSESELIGKSDIVDIVVPTNYHYILAKEAMLSGRHVFIEKPVCETIEELEDLISIQERNHNVVQVGFIERFNPAFTSIKDKIGSPRFFEVHRLAPYIVRGTEVSVVMDLMIHDLDILSYFIDAPVKSVHASGVAVLSKTPDIANARVEFENGVVANLTASRISMKRMRKMRIFSEGGYATLDFLEKTSEQYLIHSDSKLGGLPFKNFEQESRFLHNTTSSQKDVNPMLLQLKSFYQNCLNSNINTVSNLIKSKSSLLHAISVQKSMQK